MRKSKLERRLRKRYALCKRHNIKIALASINVSNAGVACSLYCDDASDYKLQKAQDELMQLYKVRPKKLHYRGLFPHSTLPKISKERYKIFRRHILSKTFRKLKTFHESLLTKGNEIH